MQAIITNLKTPMDMETATTIIQTMNLQPLLGVAMKVPQWISDSSMLNSHLLHGVLADITQLMPIFPCTGESLSSLTYKSAIPQKPFSTLKLLISSVSL